MLFGNLSSNDENTKNLNTDNICSYVQYLHRIYLYQDDWSLEWIEKSHKQDAQNLVYHCTLAHADQSSNVSFVKLAKQIPYSLKVYIGIIVIESNLKLQLLCFLSAMMYHWTFESLKNENLVQLELN